MKTATINQLKKGLKNLPQEELVELSLKMAKFKKETKEYLSYLVYESMDEDDFIYSVKEEITLLFEEINPDSFSYMKKTIRKILRLTKKYIRFSKINKTEVELLLHFCQELINVKPSINRSIMLRNIYDRQVEMIKKKHLLLHEDIQFDYRVEIDNL